MSWRLRMVKQNGNPENMLAELFVDYLAVTQSDNSKLVETLARATSTTFIIERL
jgi:hypothetical protein